MKIIEITGRNVDDAIKTSLEELNVTRDKVDVEVLDEGKKGVFNFIGSKPARIKVTFKKDYVGESEVFLREVLDSINVNAEFDVIDS